jgi:Tfp pilus assembly protein FimT
MDDLIPLVLYGVLAVVAFASFRKVFYGQTVRNSQVLREKYLTFSLVG